MTSKADGRSDAWDGVFVGRSCGWRPPCVAVPRRSGSGGTPQTPTPGSILRYMASRKKLASGPTRREWLAAVPPVMSAAQTRSTADMRRPHIIVIISDQFRADCLGALGLNPMNLTPNLHRMAGGGTLFPSAFCNQPVCAPARGTIFTGQYPSRHGVWRNGIGLPENATTLATTLRQQGYSAHYIGKWHLAPNEGTTGRGAVAPAHRGGFNDLWEAANALEWTSHAYEGELYDNDGKPIRFSGQYRTDF